MESRTLLSAGSLDTTFNPPNGYVTTALDPSSGLDIVIQPDGKIVALGSGRQNVGRDVLQIDGSGLHVYPGLILPSTYLGLSEIGGYNLTYAGKQVYLIQVAEKGVCWLKVRATGKPISSRCSA